MDAAALKGRLNSNTTLEIGEISETLWTVSIRDLSKSPIGFIAVDVNYYSSTVEALAILKRAATDYLPRALIYRMM